jgi:nucleoside-diphosphate kinase
MVEQTFVMVKPDGVQRGLIGVVVSRLEQRGYQLVAAKLMSVSTALAQEHYAEHKERPFFGELVQFITSSPVFAMVWEGPGVIGAARTMMGKTNPLDAAPGTIRGDYAVSLGMNIVHGSDSLQSAQREISLWFAAGELQTYERVIGRWI